MSHLKLELLPNELFIKLFEKYINGVDMIIGFNFPQNRRFKNLIYSCQPSCFDFTRTNKDDFEVCMDYLHRYVDGIKELAISDEQTPGQVHDFLERFSSFRPFKNLRRLYFHPYGTISNGRFVDTALQSLYDTNIKTLVLNTTQYSSNNRQRSGPQNQINYPSSLQNLIIIGARDRFTWNELSNLQKLILKNHCCNDHEI